MFSNSTSHLLHDTQVSRISGRPGSNRPANAPAVDGCARVCLREGGRLLCIRASTAAVSLHTNISRPRLDSGWGSDGSAKTIYTFHFTLGYRCRGIYITTFVLVPVLFDLCVHSPPATRVARPHAVLYVCAMGF